MIPMAEEYLRGILESLAYCTIMLRICNCWSETSLYSIGASHGNLMQTHVDDTCMIPIEKQSHSRSALE